MKITREQLRRWGACYADERIAELVPEDGLTPLEVAALDIPAGDRLWILLREDLIPARELRLLACGWAEAACQKTGWDDARSLAAIAVARRFAVGEATESDRAEAVAEARTAWSVARSTESDRTEAAASAAWAAASASSVAAALAAARSAEAATRSAEVAARSAAEAESDRAAAAAAALAAARAEQLADVVKILHRRFRATTKKGIT